LAPFKFCSTPERRVGSNGAEWRVAVEERMQVTGIVDGCTAGCRLEGMMEVEYIATEYVEAGVFFNSPVHLLASLLYSSICSCAGYCTAF
jgi:hypothetical protein